ncbi:hypothetical protein LJC71_10545 [Desulfosarcina sp. OttesenSCG-928-A07]|nr:hypothetical protein [Desulfosarcina sp. OttesenSCG-928-A07]
MKATSPRNPSLSQKEFIPWYDAEPIVLIVLCIAVAALLFSMYGIAVVAEEPAFSAYIWIPCLLSGLGAVVTFSVLVRLWRRWSPERK